ncbi:DUF2624 family protein [Bacillus alkalicellulosilyticus]|uniref:DUF2624 family protein n=1 Tax=Alkalihalobacterium alkalicellulosilyticum TaxID=1912214 RepID=UPI00099715DF|nr:DUF2624 family protein [Bacillus alkalicellulosilyticus]
MNPVIIQMVNMKVNSLTKQELLGLAQQHNISLTPDQATQVMTVLKSENIDVTNQQQVQRIISRLKNEVDPHVSNVVSQLLQQYGHYLNQL